MHLPDACVNHLTDTHAVIVSGDDSGAANAVDSACFVTFLFLQARRGGGDSVMSLVELAPKSYYGLE